MMPLLGARVDRSLRILVNTRLDGYPAYFHVEPQALFAWLQQPDGTPEAALALLQESWPTLSLRLEKLVQRHGNDFVVTAAMLA
ncbi:MULTISPECIES: hypothetical protein [unclassified Paludibacterium]|uniref:hypothetical protein n=1 Tax=unclassified Paludibacterium TaxID=2618429 RepID=UPI001C053CF9|nr:hypothetical protein [Paludibacterium sp. B53371]BEV73613.1 hypothetical protein THUN1379_30950 [Paludibacterium sp. THUN1379]